MNLPRVPRSNCFEEEVYCTDSSLLVSIPRVNPFVGIPIFIQSISLSNSCYRMDIFVKGLH